MDMRPRGNNKVEELLRKGADIPNPLSLDVGDDVDVSRISGAIAVYPGCRIYGARTAIAPGVKLGAEGPVTLENCSLDQAVELKAGYFRDSVFLAGSSMGAGAHVREACLVEEGASGAHSVGLKQTILFPFVTLGSLVNFCDCLMAGGTSRLDHSEVGSSYIHFNFTPDGDKSTASLFGDVPRGVMLDQPAIFLGGQGGAVGPLRMGYGSIVAAGSILRTDVLEDGKLIAAGMHDELRRDTAGRSYRSLPRVLRNNLIYLGNLIALEEWYRAVRAPFFTCREMGSHIFDAALTVLGAARMERIKRLAAMVEKVPEMSGGKELRDNMDGVGRLFQGDERRWGRPFLDALGSSAQAAAQCTESSGHYITFVQGLAPGARQEGADCLQGIVDELFLRAGTLLHLAEI